jgi:hypothetical protein
MEMQPQNNSHIGRRRDSRLRLRRGVPAELVTLHGKFSAQLMDLSLSGAHVRAFSPTLVGQDGVISWLGFEAFGKVVWAREGEIGIAFYDPIEPDVLLKTRQQVDQGMVHTRDGIAYSHARDWYCPQEAKSVPKVRVP